jgi:hypothetical protein
MQENLRTWAVNRFVRHKNISDDAERIKSA